MKIIINESQLRLIVENEDKSLIDFTSFVDDHVDPVKWDDMFEHLNKKKGGIYDGYYINGDVDLQDSNITQLKYLVIVEGNLDLNHSPIESLPMLKRVHGYLDLADTQIKSLPMLESVDYYLRLNNSPIESLPEGLSVGGFLNISNTPLSKTTTREELKSKINVEGQIYLGLIYI
jgi:hypothetical protein